MPPKKKGNGEDEAETCPADMDPEVWAVVKDVNQLVALASKKTSAPPVTRFDALLHLWSAAASNPRERDALIAAGALAASLTASKPDVPFLDRGAGLGLTRALTVGDERTSIPSAAHLEAASEARVAASALDALLLGSSTSSRYVADALAILLGRAPREHQTEDRRDDRRIRRARADRARRRAGRSTSVTKPSPPPTRLATRLRSCRSALGSGTRTRTRTRPLSMPPGRRSHPCSRRARTRWSTSWTPSRGRRSLN